MPAPTSKGMPELVTYETLNNFMDKEKLIRRKNARADDGHIGLRDKIKQVDDRKGGMLLVRIEMFASCKMLSTIIALSR